MPSNDFFSDGSEPKPGSAFFGGLGLDILRRAQARSRLRLDFLRRAKKIAVKIRGSSWLGLNFFRRA